MKWEAVKTDDGFALVLLSNENVVGACIVENEACSVYCRRSKYIDDSVTKNVLAFGDDKLSLFDKFVYKPTGTSEFFDSDLEFPLKDPDHILNSMCNVEKIACIWDVNAKPTGVIVVFEMLKMVEAFFESFDILVKKRTQELNILMET